MKTTNTSRKRAALIAVLVLGSGAWLSAQENQGQIRPPEDGLTRQQELKTADISTNSQASQPMKINKASSIIGSTVKNQQGEDLGKVRDLVIDFNSDRVAYVVLASGTGLFSSEKLHAVPLRAFQPDAAGTSLILNADKDKLTRSVGFAKTNWPALGTATWGAEPFWKNTPGTPGAQKVRDVDQKQYPENKDTTEDLKKIEPQPRP